VHVLAFESLCKQQRSEVESIILADGVCYALCIHSTCSCFALQSLFDSGGQWHSYCECKHGLLVMRVVMNLYMTQISGMTDDEYGGDSL